MARRAKAAGFGEYELVNVNFSDVEKEEYKLWSKGKDQTDLSDLMSIVEGGFKVSLSFQKQDASFLVSLTGKDTVNKTLIKKVFMLRHRDAQRVIGLAHYFYAVIVHLGEQMPKDMSDDLDW